MLRGSSTIAGRPKDCFATVQKYVDSGVNYFILYFMDAPDTKGMNLWSKGVIEKINS
jgi:hypothetical protein